MVVLLLVVVVLVLMSPFKAAATITGTISDSYQLAAQKMDPTLVIKIGLLCPREAAYH
jgi:hypothetical protein